MPDVSVLEVLLYDKPIGTITNVGGDRTLFAFDEKYIEDENRDVLGLGFKDSLGELITEFRPTQKQLMPFFSNLLPEGHMRTYLADRANVNSEREFFLLWVLGRDLPGAITVRPADGEAWPPDAHDDEEVADDDDDQQHQMQQNENVLRFSLAGVQLKFSAVHDARGGLTIPTRGVGGAWIVKLPSREFDGVPENEFSMMTLARLIGMDVPEIKLVDIKDIKNLPEGMDNVQGQAFAIKRFDRLSDGSVVHIEDFAQIFGIYPADKYKWGSARNIAQVIGAESSDANIAEFIRRLTFNVLIGNADMHLKNWSVIYPDRRNAAIAPAYDFLSTISYIPDSEASQKFSRTRRFDAFSEDELSHLAAKAYLSEKLVLDTAHETVELFHQHWQREKKNLPLTAKVIKTIEKHFKTIPIA